MTQESFETKNSADIGRQVYDLARRLYPICRSITGNGIRETLKILQEHVPFTVHEVASGTPVYDWVVPEEWNIKDAWIKNARGEKVVDFKKHNLHVLQYSIPVSKRVSLAELREHLFTIPDKPEWIPFRTSFFQKNWGFCLSHKAFSELEEGDYEVRIESTLKPGHLTYGEYFIPGRDTGEVVIYAHICHPSLANDNLSGIGILTFLAKHLMNCKPRLSYRFVLAPGNVGAIAWLALTEQRTASIRHGLVLACLGGPGDVHYKKSRRGNAEIDQTVQIALRDTGQSFQLREFSPYGYAERQFCSPGFDLPVGCFMRTPHGEFPQYHTSADDLDYLKAEFLADSWSKLCRVLYMLDNNVTFVNQNPKCEPRLGDRGLYGAIGGEMNKKDWEMAMLWVLNLSDGNSSLLKIAERSGLPFPLIRTTADALAQAGLLKEAFSPSDVETPKSNRSHLKTVSA
jgi:aminopeptidase-like protein